MTLMLQILFYLAGLDAVLGETLLEPSLGAGKKT
jgi:hypothetical protein